MENNELPEREKMMIEWVVFASQKPNDDEVWYKAYLLSHPTKKEADVKTRSAAGRWHKSSKVQAYLEEMFVRAQKQEDALKMKLEQKILANDNSIREFLDTKAEEKEKYDAVLSQNRGLADIITELNQEADKIKDPKDKAQVLIKIGEFQGLNKEKVQDDTHRFYTLINMDGCGNCELYKLGKEVLNAELRKAKSY